ncbi:MAG: hypothetical protein Q4E68_00855 [Prevotellaceae bacterium]|nr:hypothetical protein [Prevotellaceae bacterium]
MKKKEYKTPRSKMIFLNFRNTFLAGSSVEGSEMDDGDGEASAKRAYGRFAWDDDED